MQTLEDHISEAKWLFWRGSPAIGNSDKDAVGKDQQPLDDILPVKMCISGNCDPVHVEVCVNVCVYVCMCIDGNCDPVHIEVCMYVCVCMYTCMYVYI